METIAHPRAAAPQPPSFPATAWAVLIGFLAAAVSFGVVTIAASGLGIAGRAGMEQERRSAVDWPFTHAGVWSVASNIIVTTAILLLCAFCVADLVSRRYAEHVSLWRIFAIVVITGYAPYIGYDGLLPLHFFFAWLATTFLARQYAIGVRPPALSRRVRAALAAAVTALLLVPAAYGAAHPLWYGSYISGETGSAQWNAHRVVYSPRGPQTITYGFTLKNVSWRRATILGVSGGSSSSFPFLRVVRAEPGIVFTHPSRRPLRSYAIGHDHDQALTLFIHTLGCDGSFGTFTLDRIVIRYRLAGLTLTQPLALALRPTVVC